MTATDRSIRLDLGLPDLGPRAGDGFAPGSGRHGAPDASSQQRFEDALRGQGQPTPVPAEPEAPRLPPFGLWASRPPHAGSPMPAQTCADAPLPLDEAVTRLMVGEGSAGGRQVRMDLSDSLLPGVTVVIEEAEGRLCVTFVCSVETSRLRLNAAIEDQAPAMAQRLGRDVLLRVQADDDEDPCLFEVAASA